jgi:ankyrin repeat-rich membrane spanning protein
LLWAARKGNLEIVKLLVEKKANTELIGMNNMTPLIIASKNGHKETALYLSTVTTANLNHVDKDGNNALTISVKQGQTDVVLSLLSRGAYVNTPNKKGDNILITAVKGGHKQIIDALLDKHVEIDAIGNQGKTAMHHSVEKGNLDLVKVLLEYKPDLEITTKVLFLIYLRDRFKLKI